MSSLADHLEEDGPQADGLHGQELVALRGVYQGQLLEAGVRLLAAELVLVDDGVDLHLPVGPLEDEEVEADGGGRGGAGLEAQLVLHGAPVGVGGVLALAAVE